MRLKSCDFSYGGGSVLQCGWTISRRRCQLFMKFTLDLAVLLFVPLFVLAALPTPDLAADELSEARQLMGSGKYGECIDRAEAAISIGAADLETWYEMLVECRLATGQYDEAVEAAEQGIASESASIRLRWVGRRACLLAGQSQRAAEMLIELDDRVRYRSWRYRDALNRVVQAQYALESGADAKQVLDQLLRPALESAPEEPRVRLATGDLALAHSDFAMAADNYRKAVELEPSMPDGHMGLTRAFQSGDREAASGALQRALAINPEYVPALLELTDHAINSEQYDDAESLIARVLAVNPRDSDAWSYRAVLAHLANDPEREQECRREALGKWLTNPRVDYLIGRKLSQKYRFAESARYQRRALTLDLDYLPAKLQLANDLLRLGNDEEGWQLASEVYRSNGYNVLAWNLVTLGREMENFAVLERDGFIVRMQPQEAEIYGERVLELLVEGRRELAEKYRMTVAEPVFVEIFPEQQDFAIRTFGMPGGFGFLGVCFGRVITMNSPASRATGNINWESVLWHEFCHVVTLQKTQNRMPRWLSEGISVYEELQADPSWGQSMSPRYREMILEGELSRVSELSAAFLDPPTPEHLQFAYFQSSLVVKFLIERHGLETLLGMLDDLALGMPINDVLGRRTGGIELLEKEFADFATQAARDLAPGMDWTRPTAGDIDTVGACQAWNAAHPDNWFGLRAEAALHLRDGNWSAARPLLERLAALYPDHRAADNAWTMLGAVARGEKNEEREIESLEKSAALSADSLDVYTRLLELYRQRDEWDKVQAMAGKVRAVSPLVPLAHEQLALAAERTGNFAAAAESLGRLAQLDPVDPADVLYRYARALNETGDRDAARRQVLKCLEQAPRFREAHQLLLKIGASEPQANGEGEDAGQ